LVSTNHSNHFRQHGNYKPGLGSIWLLYSRLKIKIRGETVYIAGYNTLQKHNSAATVRVPSGANPQIVSVVWVNPDKSQVAVPITN
jgi:hypothetical protein